jgi:hypothetical protein
MIVAAPPDTPEMTLRGLLRDLRQEAERAGAADLVRAVTSLDERLRSRRLLVVVVGEHNRGKSSLINSLIGTSWLPMGQAAPVLPPVYVLAGAREHIELVYDDDTMAESTKAELLNMSPDDAASVAYARVALPSPDLYGLVLVDTPGLNDPNTTRLVQTVYGLLPRADLGLLVLDSTQALGASEYDLFREHIMRARLQRLVVVLNRGDELEDDRQREEVRDRVLQMLTPLLGSEPQILPYAARAALRAREAGDARLLSRTGYPELRALLRSCAEERMTILQHSVATRAQTLAANLSARLAAPPTPPMPDLATSTALMEQSTQVAAAARELEDVRDEYVMRIQGFTVALRERLAEETRESSPDDIRRFLPFYIQEQYETFLTELQPEIIARAEAALRHAGLENQPAIAFEARPVAPGLHPYLPPDFYEDSMLVTTFMTLIGLVLKPMIAGLVMTVGPLMRYLSRNVRESDERGALLRSAEAGVLDTGQALERQVTATFAELIDTARAATPVPEPPGPAQIVDDPDRIAARERVALLQRRLDTNTQ